MCTPRAAHARSTATYPTCAPSSLSTLNATVGPWPLTVGPWPLTHKPPTLLATSAHPPPYNTVTGAPLSCLSAASRAAQCSATAYACTSARSDPSRLEVDVSPASRAIVRKPAGIHAMAEKGSVPSSRPSGPRRLAKKSSHASTPAATPPPKYAGRNSASAERLATSAPTPDGYPKIL